MELTPGEMATSENLHNGCFSGGAHCVPLRDSSYDSNDDNSNRERPAHSGVDSIWRCPARLPHCLAADMDWTSFDVIF